MTGHHPEDMESEHPKNRAVEPEDPMELRADRVEGDMLAMLDGLIEEYARMGFGADQIEELFSQPHFVAVYALRESLGPEAVKLRIERVLERCGVFRVRIVKSDPDDEISQSNFVPAESLK